MTSKHLYLSPATTSSEQGLCGCAATLVALQTDLRGFMLALHDLFPMHSTKANACRHVWHWKQRQGHNFPELPIFDP